MEKISVIIPLYNKKDYVLKTIKSVLNQTYPYFELIIVDDGSTDESLNVIKQISDDRLIIIQQNNSGVSAARNKGVENATCDYVAFLDADDWWDITFLEKMVFLLKEYPDGVMYAANYSIVKDGISINEFTNQESNVWTGYLDYLNCFYDKGVSPICTSAVLLRKTMLQKVNGFDENLKYGEDLVLWITLSLSGRVVYTTEILSFYNFDVDSTQRAITVICPPKESFFVFNLNKFKEEEKSNESLNKLLDLLRLRFLKPYYLTGYYKKETQDILDTVIFWPFKFIVFYRLPKFIIKFLYAFTNQIK